MLSHLNAARTAVVVFPFVAAGCAQIPGSVIQSGIPYPTGSRSAAAVLPTAEQYLGVRYTWGGESPRTGFDCSGFVQYVFDRHGVRLPRTSRAQASAGSRVPLDFAYLRPGDLIMFANPGDAISHVAIYAGDRRIIHSSKSGSGVRYDDLDTRRGAWYRQNAVVARRVGTAGQGRGIVLDLVQELRSAGVRVDFPLDLGDRAPRP